MIKTSKLHYWGKTGDFIAKFEKGSREISAENFCYSWDIVFKFHWNFTYASESYDFPELYYELWSFTPDLGIFSAILYFNFKYT